MVVPGSIIHCREKLRKKKRSHVSHRTIQSLIPTLPPILSLLVTLTSFCTGILQLYTNKINFSLSFHPSPTQVENESSRLWCNTTMFSSAIPGTCILRCIFPFHEDPLFPIGTKELHSNCSNHFQYFDSRIFKCSSITINRSEST
mmetsp:Transcript_9271/g.17462  ORF Transcript_9271/g.17462 Transcript_9271/m.17462 type:complete len:145 (+) Transcript_9271:1008-1442(+)